MMPGLLQFVAKGKQKNSLATIAVNKKSTLERLASVKLYFSVSSFRVVAMRFASLIDVLSFVNELINGAKMSR